jgi:hypothetical protein
MGSTILACNAGASLFLSQYLLPWFLLFQLDNNRIISPLACKNQNLITQVKGKGWDDHVYAIALGENSIVQKFDANCKSKMANSTSILKYMPIPLRHM